LYGLKWTTHAPIQCVPEAHSTVVELLENQTGSLLSRIAEFNDSCFFASFLLMSLWPVA